MPKNDREVFDHLVIDDDKDGTRPLDFLAYAVFAHEKREWIKHYEAQHPGQSPSQIDIDNWIGNLTNSQYLSMRGEAERFFVEAADAYFADRLETERKDILRSAIVSEVKSAGAFWKQFAIALLTAVLAPLIIGGIIAGALFYDKGMFSASTLAERVTPGFEKGNPQNLPLPAR